jgi:hypothetical protein
MLLDFFLVLYDKVISKLHAIYRAFLDVSDMLDVRLLHSRIQSLYDSFFLPYSIDLYASFCLEQAKIERLKNLKINKSVKPKIKKYA